MKTVTAPVKAAKSARKLHPVAPVVGQVRRFGKFGPSYLIQKITGETCVITVPENGQTAKLTVSQIIADPLEA